MVAIYDFHMIAAIATIVEKVTEGRGDLRLKQRSRHSSNLLNMAAVNRRFLLEVCFFCTHGCFSREFRYFAVGNAVHPGIVTVATIAGEWFPYDRCDRCDRTGLSQRSLSLRSLRSLESGFHVIATIAELFFQRSQRS